MRTSGGTVWMSPMTSATASSLRAASFAEDVPSPLAPSKPKMRNAPQPVGKSADATCRTENVVTPRLYRAPCKRGHLAPCRQPGIGVDRLSWPETVFLSTKPHNDSDVGAPAIL